MNSFRPIHIRDARGRRLEIRKADVYALRSICEFWLKASYRRAIGQGRRQSTKHGLRTQVRAEPKRTAKSTSPKGDRGQRRKPDRAERSEFGIGGCFCLSPSPPPSSPAATLKRRQRFLEDLGETEDAAFLARLLKLLWER